MKKLKAERGGEMHTLEYNVTKLARKSGENVTKYRVVLAGRSSGTQHVVMFPDFAARSCPEGGDPLRHGEEQNKLRAAYFAWMEERALYEALHAAGFAPGPAPELPAELMPPPPAEEPAPLAPEFDLTEDEPPPPGDDAQEGEEQ